VDWEALESSSSGLQPDAMPSQLPVRTDYFHLQYRFAFRPMDDSRHEKSPVLSESNTGLFNNQSITSLVLQTQRMRKDQIRLLTNKYALASEFDFPWLA